MVLMKKCIYTKKNIGNKYIRFMIRKVSNGIGREKTGRKPLGAFFYFGLHIKAFSDILKGVTLDKIIKCETRRFYGTQKESQF